MLLFHKTRFYNLPNLKDCEPLFAQVAFLFHLSSTKPKLRNRWINSSLSINRSPSLSSTLNTFCVSQAIKIKSSISLFSFLAYGQCSLSLSERCLWWRSRRGCVFVPGPMFCILFNYFWFFCEHFHMWKQNKNIAVDRDNNGHLTYLELQIRNRMFGFIRSSKGDLFWYQ